MRGRHGSFEIKIERDFRRRSGRPSHLSRDRKADERRAKAVTDFAKSQGLARGQWIRDVILGELRTSPVNNSSLAEILGVRLLLVNVLRPLAAGQRLTPEAFDKLLDEIGTAKHELAGKLLTEGRR